MDLANFLIENVLNYSDAIGNNFFCIVKISNLSRLDVLFAPNKKVTYCDLTEYF